jgi:hypothetical protein
MNQNNFHLFFKNSFFKLAIAIIPLFSLSCEKEYDPLFNNGVIWGYATIYKDMDETGTIRVVAKGPYGSKSVDIYPNEMYWIDSLANGTYALDFIKEGYGTVHLYGIQVFGNDTVGGDYVNLFSKHEDYVMPSFIKAYPAVRENSYPLETFICIEISEIAFWDFWGLPILLYLSDKKDVSCTNFRYYYPAWDVGTNNASANLIYLNPSLPFKSGTEVFVIGYVCDTGEYMEGNLDTYLGIPQFSSLDKERHSDIVSFIMP